MQNKFDKLIEYLKKISKQGICLAFSGGVDSLLLLYLCKDLNICAVTLSSCFQKNEEINFSKTFCKKNNIKHKIIEYFPLDDENIKNNPKDRCYYCKKLMFQNLKKYALENGFMNIIDGTNYDDTKYFRPGLKAIDEFKITSPFKKFKITKSEIREYLSKIDTKLANKNSNSCLATRFPYNQMLDIDNIKKIEKIESFLIKLGISNVRARLHNNILRIEVPKNEFNKFFMLNSKIITELKKYNISYITLDLEGLRTGSMDNS